MRRILLYILCLFAFIELSSRMFWQMLDHTWGFIVPQQVGRYDPDLGWSLRPGATASSKATGQKVEYIINSLGFRGPETTVAKAEGTFRIVTVGDSHTFGFGIPQQGTFSYLLQGYFKNVEVVNLGVSGFGIDQFLLRLRRDGFPLKPDLVICYVPHYADGRHMTDKLWALGKPRFIEQGGSLTLTNQPVANNSPVYLSLLAVDRFLGQWCRTYEILRNTVYYLTLPTTKAPPEINPEVLAETNRMGWLIAQEMERECQEHGAAFVLSTREGELGLNATKAGFYAHFMAWSLFNQRVLLPNDPFKHPGPAADGVMAWELARYIMERGLIPQSHWILPPAAIIPPAK